MKRTDPAAAAAAIRASCCGNEAAWDVLRIFVFTLGSSGVPFLKGAMLLATAKAGRAPLLTEICDAIDSMAEGLKDRLMAGDLQEEANWIYAILNKDSKGDALKLMQIAAAMDEDVAREILKDYKVPGIQLV